MAIIFSYAFDTTAKNQLDNGNTADPDAARNDVERSGDWFTSNGRGWEIKAAAACPLGTGLGVRHYRGDGTNDNSGGIIISLPSPENEIWVRFYMRYQSGFSWADSAPEYTKDMYWNQTVIFGHQGGAWGIFDGTQNRPGSVDWQDTMGGATGDGLWHCYEYHVKMGTSDGIIEVWVDNVQTLNLTGLNLGTDAFDWCRVGENQDEVTGAGAADFYTDYDEIVISDSGRVGPLEAEASLILRPAMAM